MSQRGPIFWLATWFGLGLAPWAPGTFGTLGALPLWWAMARLPLLEQGVVAAVAAVFAVLVCLRADRAFGKHDDRRVVIDEVAGLLLAALAVPFRWPEVVAVFGLFRFFDALKPWPIGWLDRNVGGGFGVVLDDLAAGAVTLTLVHGARLFLGGWW